MIKPIGYYSTTPLANSLAQQYEGEGVRMPLDRAVALAETILQQVREGDFTDTATLIWLACVIDDN